MAGKIVERAFLELSQVQEDEKSRILKADVALLASELGMRAQKDPGLKSVEPKADSRIIHATDTTTCRCDRVWQSVYSRTSPEFNDKRKDARAHARLFEELARENPKMTRRAIIAQGKYSDIENLHFLYGFTNDVEYAGLAINAIVRVLGVTSNALEIVDHAMDMDQVSFHEKYHICIAIAEMAKCGGVSEENRKLGVSALRRYARVVPESSTLADAVEDAVARRSFNRGEEEAVSRPATDKEIKAAFLSATEPTFCGNRVMGAYKHAIELCKGDDRRMSRIAREIAVEYTNRVPWAISALRNHGSSEDVPFLLCYTNDLDFAARAVSSVIHINGITSNVVELANDIMYKNLKREYDRYDICSALAYAAKKDGVSASDKQLSVSALKRYSRTIPATALWADEFLLSLDPAYEASDDRKALLREVAERRVNDYQIDYATNALKRIDAKVQTKKEER